MDSDILKKFFGLWGILKHAGYNYINLSSKYSLVFIQFGVHISKCIVVLYTYFIACDVHLLVTQILLWDI